MLLCSPRHGEVWRGCPAAPRADRPAQDKHKPGPGKQGHLSVCRPVLPGPGPMLGMPCSHRAYNYWTYMGPLLSPLLPELCLNHHLCSLAWEEVADAEDASESYWRVPASDHIAGPTADYWGGERAGRAGLQGAQAAAAGGSSVTAAALFPAPHFREEGRDTSVTSRPGPPQLGLGRTGRWPGTHAGTPRPPMYLLASAEEGSRPWLSFFLPKMALLRVTIC